MKFVSEGDESLKFVPVEIIQFRAIQLNIPPIDLSGYPIVIGDYSVGGQHGDNNAF